MRQERSKRETLTYGCNDHAERALPQPDAAPRAENKWMHPEAVRPKTAKLPRSCPDNGSASIFSRILHGSSASRLRFPQLLMLHALKSAPATAK